jgi:hypothetical protein
MVLKKEEEAKGKRRKLDPVASFSVLAWIGIGFLVMGGVDLLLAWYPPAFGSQEWQFATATQSFSRLPVPILGIGVLLVASAQMGRSWWAFLGVGASAVFLLFAVLGVVLFGINVPTAISQVPDEVATGMYRSIARTTVQSLVYPVVLAYLAWMGWRIGRSAQLGE